MGSQANMIVIEDGERCQRLKALKREYLKQIE